MTLLPMMTAALLAAAHTPNASELAEAFERLGTVGNVLFVAAHPDDEDTRLLAYLVHQKHLRTAYLSLTRGEGGQNFLGSEKAPLLGVIRTQELLAARRIDGAEQFFTRARDFGFSKSPEETLRIWAKDEVLADMVWVIRRFKPDLIVARFPPEGRKDDHGHHIASAQLSVEAFRLAADPAYHPEQLAHVALWQAKRLVLDVPMWGAKPGEVPPGSVAEELGGFNPRLGVSYGELAAQSRSMHKSQGFGSAAARGARPAYFRLLAGEPMKDSLFDGLVQTWNRVNGQHALAQRITQLAAQFQPANPAASIPALLEVRRTLAAAPDFPWKTEKLAELDALVADCAGLIAEATAAEATTVPGGSLKVTATVVNRSAAALTLQEVRLPGGTALEPAKPLANNVPFEAEQVINVPGLASLSNPYWLEGPPNAGTFAVLDPTLAGMPEEPAALNADFVLSASGQTFTLSRPITYGWTDPVGGERSRRVEVLPPVTVNPAAPILMFPDAEARELRVVLKASAPNLTGTVRLAVSGGWRVQPEAQAFSLTKKGDEEEVAFSLQPPPAAGSATVRVIADVGGQPFSRGLRRIEYPHIPIQTLLPEAEVKLVRFDLKRGKRNVGYIMGAGDEVPEALRQVDYDVTLLDDAALRDESLARFDAVVVGVRAYSTNPRMPFHYAKLMSYVEGGGVLLVQYDTGDRFGPLPPDIGPYPFKITRDRVTDETAAVTFDAPTHPLMLQPNVLGPADFDGWVQERGLYFAGTWDEHYLTLFSMHDPGEPALRGSLLVAPYGKGLFLYTGLAFFRQLPAGVPGAFRLFANLLAHGR